MNYLAMILAIVLAFFLVMGILGGVNKKEDRIDENQIVWHKEWQGFHLFKIKKGQSLALIYDYIIYIGFLEIRKWHKFKEGDIEENYKENK